MADTPRSDRGGTRFSTPVAELDDHRFQPASLPLADVAGTSYPGTRRGTVASLNVPERSDLLRVEEVLDRAGKSLRDYENAIVEDDKSGHGPYERRFGRRGSTASPIMMRRNTFRRTREEQGDVVDDRKSSASSSRSASPPNSVDAFADPRRRERAGTVTSNAPSDLDLALHRTVSRRPTFGEDKSTSDANDSGSRHSSVEDDVCFPVPEETGKTYTIDFEELEEFVASVHTKTPTAQSLKHRSPRAESPKPRIFNDLRPNSAASRHSHRDESQPETDEELAEKLGEADRHTVHDIPINRWAFFSSELDDTIHAPDLGGLLMPNETFRDLFELSPDGGVWWLDMFNPTEEEVQVICKAFGVHPLTKEDILTQEAREKVELFKSYYFLCFRSFYQLDKMHEDYLEPVNVYAVVFREGLLTFTFCQNPHAQNVRKRIGRLRHYVALSADWICYALIDDIVDSFQPVIQEIEQHADSIEDQVFTARAEDTREILRAMGECRKKVISLTRLLGGKADVIKGFAKRCNEHYSVAPRGDVGLYLSDIQDHVVTMMSSLGHFEKMLSRSHGNYLTQIQVDSLEQGNRINEMLGKVTLLATVLLPLNLVTGLFGMNVPVPGRESGGLGWFFGILGGALTFLLVCCIVARRLRFI